MIGVLLLHGFAGSRSEVEYLKKHLEQKGVIVSMPVLAGHESTYQAFAKAKHTDWINSALQAANELEKKCEKMIVIGFSMGGLLAVNLCQKKKFEKLVLINAPVYYWNLKQIFRNLICNFNQYSKHYIWTTVSKPVPALIEFLKLLHQSKQWYGTITIPTLVLQAMDDDTVHPKSGEYIFRHVRGEKKMVSLANGGHVILKSPEAGVVCKEIEAFIT